MKSGLKAAEEINQRKTLKTERGNYRQAVPFRSEKLVACAGRGQPSKISLQLGMLSIYDQNDPT